MGAQERVVRCKSPEPINLDIWETAAFQCKVSFKLSYRVDEVRLWGALSWYVSKLRD